MPKYSKTAFQVKSKDGSILALRGRIDDFIFRTRNGKIFAFYKPRRSRTVPEAIPNRFRKIATQLNLIIVERKPQSKRL